MSKRDALNQILLQGLTAQLKFNGRFTVDM